MNFVIHHDSIEILYNGEPIGEIRLIEDGLEIVSRYLDGAEHEVGCPPNLVVRFSLPIGQRSVKE